MVALLLAHIRLAALRRIAPVVDVKIFGSDKTIRIANDFYLPGSRRINSQLTKVNVEAEGVSFAVHVATLPPPGQVRIQSTDISVLRSNERQGRLDAIAQVVETVRLEALLAAAVDQLSRFESGNGFADFLYHLAGVAFIQHF